MTFGHADDVGGAGEIQRHRGGPDDIRLEFVYLCPEFFRGIAVDDIVEDTDFGSRRLEGCGDIGYAKRRCGCFFQGIGRCYYGNFNGSASDHCCGKIKSWMRFADDK